MPQGQEAWARRISRPALVRPQCGAEQRRPSRTPGPLRAEATWLVSRRTKKLKRKRSYPRRRGRSRCTLGTLRSAQGQALLTAEVVYRLRYVFPGAHADLLSAGTTEGCYVLPSALPLVLTQRLPDQLAHRP